MYIYKCTAVENGGKQDFYDVIGQLREMYPELTEDTNVKSDKKFLRRSFYILQNRVTVQYSYSEQSVTVYSKEWLEEFYREREVEAGQFPMRGTAGAGTMWAISGVYFVLMVLLIFAIAMVDPDILDTEMSLVPILILAVVNTLAGIFIRRLTDMSFPNLILCQAVGFVTAFAVFIFIINFAFGISLLDFLVGLFALVGFLSLLLHLFLPAFVISLLLQGVTELIIKKIYGSKKVKGEDMTRTE